MVTHNALDELLPGPAPSDPAPTPPPGRVLGSRRTGSYNALDELLPGPAQAAPELGAVPAGRGRMGAFNALDALAGMRTTPTPRHLRRGKPAKVRTTFSVSRELLKAVRDTLSQLPGGPRRGGLDDLAERALKAELDRLARRSRRS